MGHRALAAYRREDGKYDLHYSHWGGEKPLLGCRIGLENPHGSGAVDPDRFAIARSIEEVLSHHLDPCTYEVLYLVSRGFEVTSYRVCWLGWTGEDGPAVGRGSIVEESSRLVDRELEIWLRATKSTLGDFVEMGPLSRETARSYLERRLRREWDGRIYTYRGAPTDDTDVPDLR